MPILKKVKVRASMLSNRPWLKNQRVGSTLARGMEPRTSTAELVSPGMPGVLAAVTLPFIIFFCIFSIHVKAEEIYKPKMMAEVIIPDGKNVIDFLKLHLDIASADRKQQSFTIVTSQDEIDDLTGKGYSVKVIVPDIRANVSRAIHAKDNFGAYHTYQETQTELNAIHNDHPSITTGLQVIGHSIEGREIWSFKISDNPDIDEDEPEVLYTALHHAREPMSLEVLLYFINYLTDNYGIDSTVTDIVNERELWFIPVVNPDGYVYNETYPDKMWRKNRHNNGGGTYGVDINRNYGYKWGYDDIGSSPSTNAEDYRGTGAFSEPETQVVRDFCGSHNFVLAFNYHSYGGMYLYPWGYTSAHTQHNTLFSALGNRMSFNNGYEYGTGGETLYFTNGDSDDWMYGEQTLKNMVLSFTVEVGTSSDDFWPPEERILPICQENLSSNLFLASIADDPNRASSQTWYLAEGSTLDSFDTWILIMNPNSSSAVCQVTFMKSDGSSVVNDITVDTQRRYTIHANDYIDDDSFSTKVTCTNGLSIVVERSMYWSAEGITWVGGHNGLGVTDTATTWYLAEGYTGGSFETYLLIQNPNDSDAACTITYMPQDGTPVTQTKTIPANSRETIDIKNDSDVPTEVQNTSFSTKVECTSGIIVERAMYWSGGGIIRAGGHDTVGVTSQSTTWYLAEGCTNGFDTYILIQNPNTSDAAVTLTYMDQDGNTKQEDIIVQGQKRYTRKINDVSDMNNKDGVSTTIQSDIGVIAERSMYWSAGGIHWKGGHCATGATRPTTTWYLAEGCTNGFDTYILIQNPNASAATVTLTYMDQNGNTEQEDITVQGQRRYTRKINDVTGMNNKGGVSVKIQSTNGIIAERAMYWDSAANLPSSAEGQAVPSSVEGHCSKGYAG